MLKWIWNSFGLLLLIFFIVIGFYEPKAVVFALLCMAGPIVSALLGFGRYWCRFLCPRGLLYDNYFDKYKSKSPAFLTSKIFKVCIVILIFVVLGLGIYNNVGNLEVWGIVLHRIIIVTTLVGIILGIKYNCRTWCCFCPMGSIATFIISIKKKFNRE